MRYISFILIALMCTLGSFAQSNKKVKQGTINALTNSLKNNAVDPLDNEIQSLENQIELIKLQIDRVKNRRFKRTSNTITTEDLTNRLNKYPTLSSLLDDEYEKDGYVSKLLDKAEESSLVNAYRLIIDMNNSLNAVYNRETNSALKERIERSKGPLERHSESYEILAGYVKDYRYYMFELGRLLASDKGRDLKGSSERKALKLTELEDAEDLIDVPFTYDILKKYFDGDLTEEDKKMLYDSCPDAFPNYKP